LYCDSRCSGIAAIALLAEKMHTGVSGVIGTGVSPTSPGRCARMADRALEHDLPVAAQHQRDAGVHAGGVQPLGGAPDRLDAVTRHAD